MILRSNPFYSGEMLPSHGRIFLKGYFTAAIVMALVIYLLPVIITEREIKVNVITVRKEICMIVKLLSPKILRS